MKKLFIFLSMLPNICFSQTGLLFYNSSFTSVGNLNTGQYAVNSSSGSGSGQFQVDGNNLIAQLISTPRAVDGYVEGLSYGIGKNAGRVNTGNYNIFIGNNSGYYNTDAFANTFIGYWAGYTNQQSGGGELNGCENTFVGAEAGVANNTGVRNTFIGELSGWNNQSGSSNTAVGQNAGYTSGTGAGGQNTHIGNYSGYTNSTGNGNVNVGYESGRQNATGDSNVSIGYQAGFSNTASGNSFVGAYSGYANGAGTANSFFGSSSGQNNTGNNNTFLGSASGFLNTSGAYNTFVGQSSGYSNILGTGNTFIGYFSGYTNTGFNNVFLGMNSGVSSVGSSSTIVGYNAGYGLTSGQANVLLGYQAGYNLTTGSNNIIIGWARNASAAGVSNSLNIGDLIVGDTATSSATILGNLYANNYYGNGNTLSNIIQSSATGNYLIRVATATYLATAPGDCAAGQYISGLTADGTKTCGTPSGSGDAVLSATQTFTGSNTFTSSVTFPTRDKITFGNELSNSSSTIIGLYQTGQTASTGCVTGSTLTITTQGNTRLMVGYTGIVYPTGVATRYISYAIDGVNFNSGIPINLGYMSAAMPLSFTSLSNVLTAGSHSVCLKIWQVSGSLNIYDGSDGSPQFWIQELR